MERGKLNGTSLRLPFVGAVTFMTIPGNWRGDADRPRAFVTRYQEPGDPAVQYSIGWLSILRDPPDAASHNGFVIRTMGCAIALRAIILSMLN